MRHPDIDLMMVMERRREELAEAQQYRLAKAALEGTAGTRARPARLSSDMLILVLARSLSFLGGHMLNWSCRLQVRYQARQPISPCG